MGRALSDDLRLRVLKASAAGMFCAPVGGAVWGWDFDGDPVDRTSE